MRRISLILSTLLILGLMLSACGSETEAPAAEPTEAPAAEPTEAPAAEPTEAPAAEPTEAPVAEAEETSADESEQSGGIYRFNFGLPADRFGVPLNTIHYNQVYAGIPLEALIQPSNDEAGVYLPRLATSWELAEDRSSITFVLREGVTFHDGSVFNAEVAKWNLDNWLAGGTPLLSKVTSVEVVDEYTIRCDLSAWDALLMNDFSRVSNMISKEAFEANGEEWANNNPIGTGPWKLVEFEANQFLKFEAFADYWNEDVPQLAGLEIQQAPDPVTAIAMAEAGEVNALYQVDPVTASQLRDTGYQVDVFPGLHQMLVMNTAEGSIWSDLRMREALEYAIDKVTITDALGQGFMKPYYEVIHSIHEAGGQPGTTPREYDVEKAKQLMAEAGYPDGIDDVTLTVQAGPAQDLYVALQANLAEVGINIEINPVDPVAFNQTSFEPPVGNDLRIEGMRGGTLNPLGSAKETLSANTVYFPGIARPDGFEELLEQALGKEDPAEQMALLEEMEKLLYDDLMLVPLWNLPIVSVDDGTLDNMIWAYGGVPSPRFDWASFNQ